MFNLISAVFAFSIMAIIFTILISLLFQWLTLYIGACIVGVSDRNHFIKSHFGIVILMDIVANILINAASKILVNAIFPMDAVLAIASGILTFICHYYVSFRHDTTGIRKGMSIFYAIVAAVFTII